MQVVVGSNPGLANFFFKNRLEIPVQRTGKPLYRLQGNPCRDYKKSMYRVRGNPLLGLQGFCCTGFVQGFPVSFFQKLQGLQVTWDPCHMYMQVTG